MATEAAAPSQSWQDLVARKQSECKQKIPSEWTLSAEQLAVPSRLLEHDLPRRSGLLSDLELDLTENYTAAQLLAKLASGEASSLAVTTAFCKRAAIAQQVVCCVKNNNAVASGLTTVVDILPHRNILPGGSRESQKSRCLPTTRR
jgi:hypothetical protein